MARRFSAGVRRVVLLDELRGLSILLMILYHGVYDLVFLFGVQLPLFSWPFRALQMYICMSFILISGISSRFSRSNGKRGLIAFLIAMAMSAVTWFAMPGQFIAFGVLHFLGISMMLHGAIFPESRNDRSPAFVGLLACLGLFALTWGVSDGYIGFFGSRLVELPRILYSQYFLFPVGLHTSDFYSADYFPLLPWVFWFFAGSFLGVAFRESSVPEFFYRPRAPFLQWLGRHSLVIYVLHQPALYGLLTVVFMGLKALGWQA